MASNFAGESAASRDEGTGNLPDPGCTTQKAGYLSLHSLDKEDTEFRDLYLWLIPVNS